MTTVGDIWRFWGVVLMGLGLAGGVVSENLGHHWWTFEGAMFLSMVGTLIARWGR